MNGKPKHDPFKCREKHCPQLSYFMKGYNDIGNYCEEEGRPTNRIRSCPLETTP